MKRIGRLGGVEVYQLSPDTEAPAGPAAHLLQVGALGGVRVYQIHPAAPVPVEPGVQVFRVGDLGGTRVWHLTPDGDTPPPEPPRATGAHVLEWRVEVRGQDLDEQDIIDLIALLLHAGIFDEP